MFNFNALNLDIIYTSFMTFIVEIALMPINAIVSGTFSDSGRYNIHYTDDVIRGDFSPGFRVFCFVFVYRCSKIMSARKFSGEKRFYFSVMSYSKCALSYHHKIGCWLPFLFFQKFTIHM